MPACSSAGAGRRCPSDGGGHLPVHSEPDAATGHTDGGREGSPRITQGVQVAIVKTILVVDDEEAVVEFVASLLEDSGYRVLRAYDGLSALEIARAEHPDLVVTDIMMPIMNGIELCRQLHASPDTAHIPIVFMTAGRLHHEGCPEARLLAKPFDLGELEDAVSCALSTAPAI